MSRPTPERLTALLECVNRREAGAADALAAAVYAELHAMATRAFAGMFGPRRGGLTLQPTALADDTFMRLLRQRQQYDNSGHFFAIACTQMRRLLVDYARERLADKRGGRAIRVTLPDEAGSPQRPAEVDVLALNETIEKLEKLDSRKAAVVQYRILWGCTIEETAAALGVAHATVERDWAFAKVWLAKELAPRG